MKIPYWDFLLGERNKKRKEQRAVHAVSLVSMLLLLLITPFNYYIGLKEIADISLGYLIIAALIFYLSRFRNKFRMGMILYPLFCLSFIIVCYIFNSGLSGPSLILVLLIFTFVITLDKQENYSRWVVVHISMVVFLLAFEYFWPELIKNVYDNRRDRFLDVMVSTVITVASVGYLGKYLRNNYEEEKKEVEARNLEIKEINERLEESNRTKNQILSVISHDLRSPIAAIQSYLNVVHQVTLEGDEKRQLEQELLIITQSTSNLLDNLLSFAKLENQTRENSSEPVDLMLALKSILHIYKPIAALKSIKLEMEECDTAVVTGDQHMIYFIIRNLVNNAVKFTQTGGNVYISCSKTDQHIVLSVADNGCGIEPGKLDNLFLENKSSVGTKGETGLGIGLPLAYEFIKRMNGFVSVTSEPGKGSIFRVSLPKSTR